MLFKKTKKQPQSDVDCALFDEVFEDSKRFLDCCDYRVDSTDLPQRFVPRWLMPDARSKRERERLRELFESDRPGVLIQLPLAVFDYACYKRYDAPAGREPEAGPADEAAVRQKLDEDPAFRAEAERFNRRFAQFQQLMRYLFTMHVTRQQERMVRFDLFDVEAYDAVLDRIGGDCDQCEVPHVPFLRRL